MIEYSADERVSSGRTAASLSIVSGICIPTGLVLSASLGVPLVPLSRCAAASVVGALFQGELA